MGTGIQYMEVKQNILLPGSNYQSLPNFFLLNFDSKNLQNCVKKISLEEKVAFI